MKAPDVLLIEDDVWLAELYMRTLKGAGCTVRHATDGVAGIRAMDESIPDVVILDIFLPGPNGLVLLHEMQSYSDLSTLPVIVCTNSTAAFPSRALAAYGVKGILDKSEMQPSDLVAAVRRVLL